MIFHSLKMNWDEHWRYWPKISNVLIEPYISQTLSAPDCQMWDADGVKHLTCKLCSCCRSSGCGYRTWTGRRARWWRRSRPGPPRWWCPESPVGFQLWSVGETPLVSERLIKKRAVKAGSGRWGSHRNFTLVHWWDNEGSLDGNIARGGFELRHLTPIKWLDSKL